jgi:hypothetical protein
MKFKTKTIGLFFVFLLAFQTWLFPRIVSEKEVAAICKKLIRFENKHLALRTTKEIIQFETITPLIHGDKKIGYIIHLEPEGFIISPGITELTPVKFISFNGTYDQIKDHPFIQQIVERIEYTRSRLYGQKSLRLSDKEEDTVDGKKLTENEMVWLKIGDQNYLDSKNLAVYAIPPMTTSTWSQGVTTSTGNAYNMYTPTIGGQHTYTGCSATAQAQIMYYWKYPTTGTGSHSYSWNGQTLSASFNHTYYWSLMVDDYDGSQTAAQEDAVGRLMSDVGISIDMDYGLSGSGAVPNDNNSLYNFFYYSSDVNYENRSSYVSWDAWFLMFKAQMIKGWPAILATFKPTGGHAVVIDGYRTSPSNQVHVNMGWGGSADGYYSMDDIYGYGDASRDYAVVDIHPAGTVFEVLSPNGGEYCIAGTSYNITWTSPGTFTNVKIEYSLNNGSSWTTETSSTSNDGSYTWTVPGTLSTQCLVRISDASDGAPSEVSDDVFSIISPSSNYRGVVAIDANSGCADELFCDFGSNGLWVYYGTWLKLNAGNPDWIVGFEHGGVEYLLCDFGSAGLWYWYYNGSWSGQFVKITSANPDLGIVVDDDGDGNDEVHLTFGANGLWRYDMGNATILTKLHTTCPSMGDSLRSDILNAGIEEGALDYGASGLWTVWDDSGPSWLKLNASSPNDDNVSAECGIGDAAEELICDFGGTGLWLYDSSSWHKLNNSEADDIVAAALPSSADYELLCTFNGSSGLWLWDWGGVYPGTWSLISSLTPDSGGGYCEPFDPNDDGWEEVAVDFAANGLWLYNHAAATKWTKINTDNPEFMLGCDYYCEGNDTALVVDFGSAGLWLYNGKTGAWTKLSSFSPDGIN